MAKYEDNPDLYDDDFGLLNRMKQAGLELIPATPIWVEAKDIALGGLEKLRNSPVGSIEVGSAIAATGFALGAATFRHRTAH